MNGYVACWKCSAPLACADAVGVPVVALTTDVQLCADCAGELDERLDGRAPTVGELHEWRDPTPEYVPATVSITLRDKATGEVIGAFRDGPKEVA